MIKYWIAINDEPDNRKEQYFVLKHLWQLYGKFDDAECLQADTVLSEWALSNNKQMRYDALFLIEDMKIKTEVRALRESASRLATSKEPDAPFELEKLLRKIALLTA